ncbi:MAG: hypothetical protein JOZ15_04775 [Acidobacteria bacterium]|nr:hypothetical protein [Acidobacteriota bacterium]
MSSRSLRRSVAILGLAALLAPAAAVHAGQSRPLRAPATHAAPRHNPVIEFLLRLVSGATSVIENNAGIDING